MKRLSLLRHAKSSWGDPRQRDFDRPLNARGREAAPIMGAYMGKSDLVPDVIMCSTAARTRETLTLLLSRLRAEPIVEFRDDFYLAEPSVMMTAVRQADPRASHVLIIAHNPGLEMLAMRLTDPEQSDIAALARIAEKYPTAALASFAGPDTWADFGKCAAALDLFVTPKSLLAD